MCQGSWESHKVDGLIRLKVMRRASLSHNQEKGGTRYRCPPRKTEHLKRWYDSVELFFIREIIVYQSFPTCWRPNECGIALFRISSVLHVMWCLMLTLKTQQTAEEEASGPIGWSAGRYRTKPVRFVTRWYSFWACCLLGFCDFP